MFPLDEHGEHECGRHLDKVFSMFVGVGAVVVVVFVFVLLLL